MKKLISWLLPLRCNIFPKQIARDIYAISSHLSSSMCVYIFFVFHFLAIYRYYLIHHYSLPIYQMKFDAHTTEPHTIDPLEIIPLIYFNSTVFLFTLSNLLLSIDMFIYLKGLPKRFPSMSMYANGHLQKVDFLSREICIHLVLYLASKAYCNKRI